MAHSGAQGLDFPLNAWNFGSVFVVVKLIIVQDSALWTAQSYLSNGLPKSLSMQSPHLGQRFSILPIPNASTLPFPPHRKAHSLVSAHMKINCTGYEYKKRNWVLRLFCDRATVCMVPLSSVVFSGSRTYFRDRNWGDVSGL
jgi:hypothetical protein